MLAPTRAPVFLLGGQHCIDHRLGRQYAFGMAFVQLHADIDGHALGGVAPVTQGAALLQWRLRVDTIEQHAWAKPCSHAQVAVVNTFPQADVIQIATLLVPAGAVQLRDLGPVVPRVVAVHLFDPEGHRVFYACLGHPLGMARSPARVPRQCLVGEHGLGGVVVIECFDTVEHRVMDVAVDLVGHVGGDRQQLVGVTAVVRGGRSRQDRRPWFDLAQRFVLGAEGGGYQQRTARAAAGAVEATGDAAAVALELVDAADDVKLAGDSSARHAVAFPRTRYAEQGHTALTTKDGTAARRLVTQTDEVSHFHVQPPALPLAHEGAAKRQEFPRVMEVRM